MALNTNRSPGDPIESSDINDIASTVNSVNSLATATDKRVVHGSGAPSHLAAPGTIYVDKQATTGAQVWIRTASGWRISDGDTGWRDINSHIVSSVAAPGGGPFESGGGVERCAIRRVGNAVHFFASVSTSVDFTPATDVMHIPAGFIRSSAGTPYIGPGYANSQWLISHSGRVTLYGVSGAAVAVRGYWTYITDDAWPAMLPGIPR